MSEHVSQEELDSDYEAHLVASAEAEEAFIAEASRTREFLIFAEERQKTVASLRFVNRAHLKKSTELRREVHSLNQQSNTAIDESKSFLLKQEAHISQAVLESLDYAYRVVTQSQRQVYYAHLINTLENYVIDIVKRLLISFPNFLKLEMQKKLSAQITFEDLKLYLNQPPEMLENYLLTRIIESGERGYSLSNVLPVLNGFKHFVLLNDKTNPLKRAQAVRNKITHRAGRIDQAFHVEIAKGSEPAVGLYPLIGTSTVAVGCVYEVSEAEFDQAVDMVYDLARTIEETLAKHYSAMISLEPWELNFHLQELELGLNALTD